MTKQAKSKSSIFKRTRPSGSEVWVGVASAGWRPDGRRRRVTVYGRSQREVVEKLAEKRGVRATTAQLYEKALAVHVRPHLDGAPLARLRPLHVLDWLAALEREKVGPRMRQVAFDALRRACGFGVDTGLLGRDPTAKVKRPRSPRSRHSPPRRRARCSRPRSGASRGSRPRLRCCSAA